VHIELFPDGVRRITHITDTTFDDKTGEAKLENIFEFIQDKMDEDGHVSGHWVMSGHKPSFYQKFVKKNVAIPEGSLNQRLGS